MLSFETIFNLFKTNNNKKNFKHFISQNKTTFWKHILNKKWYRLNILKLYLKNKRYKNINLNKKNV